MLKHHELPDCIYEKGPTLISPISPTPQHKLYLSNLDDQKFLRFSIKYLYIFRKSVDAETLKKSLSRVLVEYYPLAGRLRRSKENYDHKLEIECNGEGAVFAEATMDSNADEILELAKKPNKALRKLLYRVEASDFLDIPPLIVQVTNLQCGGMIMCTAINHCLCDGIGTAQFLHAWAHITNNSSLPIVPFHFRQVLKPRNPPQVIHPHPGFTKITPGESHCHSVTKFLQSQLLVPSSITFSRSQILHLKKQCGPSMKCTTFEILASHTWLCWVKSLNLSHSTAVKLLFSVNVRHIFLDNLPQGYYGNCFVLGCAEANVRELVVSNLHVGVKLVQRAKSTISENYVKSMIDLLDDERTRTNLSSSLVISQWSKLGLEELDFGQGKPLHMGPLTSDIYCLFLPVIGDFDSIRVLVSMPESMIDKFEFHMTEFVETLENGGSKKNQYEIENRKLVSV